MDLFFSTEKFKLNGQSYKGFPILISKNGNVVEEALDFCISHLIKRGRVASRKSWITYGKALYQFFGWCEVNNVDWRDVGNDREATILAEFRDWNLSSEGGSLSAATVNARLRFLCAYYRYAANRGWVATVPYGGSRYLAAKCTVAVGPILFQKFGDGANELNWLFFICFVQYRKITFWL